MVLRSSRTALALLLLGVSATAAIADDTVLPGGYDAAAGTGAFLGPLANSQRTYQWLIHSDQLTSLVGHYLSGITYRSLPSATTAWPAAAVDFTSYDIRLSEGVAPASRNLASFAANVVGTQTLVRSGPLHIEAEVFQVGSSPQPFGPSIDFDPWLYTGGHLLIELRHTGFSGTSRSVDALTTSTTGYGTQFSAMWTSSYTAAAGGSQGNFSVIQLWHRPADGGACNLADITESGGTLEEPGSPDGQLTLDDILVFVDAYNDSTGCPGTAPCNLADITESGGTLEEPGSPDGQLTLDDILVFVDSYNAGC